MFELSNAEIEKIKDYFRKLNKDIEVIDVKPEFLNEESMKHIANGNYRVKIRFLASKKDEVKIKVGKHNLGNRVSTLVTRLGEKPKCMLCSAEDHLRKDCPKRKLKCDYCNKTGHKADECNLAKRLDKSNDIDEENDMNSDDLNGNVQPEKEQVKSNEANNENALANQPNQKASQPGNNPRLSAFKKPNDPSKPPEKPILLAESDASNGKKGQKNKHTTSPISNSEETEKKKNKEDRVVDDYFEYSDDDES